MTTAANSSQFYLVPDTQIDVSAHRGLASLIVFIIDIDDATLREADPADDYFDLITQDSSDIAPFAPFGVCAWGNRLVWFANYGGTDSILISDQGNPQWLTADQHVLQLPGGVAISGWFVLRGALYVLSSSGKTYAFSDNGDKPVNFSVPVEIDANIGTPSPGAVTATGGSSGYALVASPQGLYIFAGTNYPQIPLSYLQTPRWEQIDWSAIEEMKLLDFTKERLILFRCKMLDSTYRMLTWSYSKGFSSDKSDYSEWFLWETKGMPAVIHRSHLSSGQELWIGAGSVADDRAVRLKVENYDSVLTFHLDSTAFPPGSYQIPWWYQIGPFPPRSQGKMLHHLGCRLRLDGGGRIYIRPVKMTDGAWGSAPTKVADIPVDIVSGQPFYDVVLDDPIESTSEREVEAVYWLIGNAETGAGGTWAEMILPWASTTVSWDSLAVLKGWMKLSTLIHLHTPYLERR
jgi:hypothetical protein